MRERKQIERDRYIKKLHLAGASVDTIGREFDISGTRVDHILYGKPFVSRRGNKQHWHYLKNRVYEQFHFKCTSCNKWDDQMDILPADGNRRNDRLENLIPICRKCNREKYYHENNN